MKRSIFGAFALGSLAGPLLLAMRQDAPPDARRPFPWPQREGASDGEEGEERGLTAREKYRRKIERDLEGLWKIEQVSNPSFRTTDSYEGYFLFYRGWVAYTITATAHFGLFREFKEGMFQTGFKRYEVSADGRLLLQNEMGLQRFGSDEVSRTASTETEEREVSFEVDGLRIVRGPGDHLLLTRVPTEKPVWTLPRRPRAISPIPGMEPGLPVPSREPRPGGPGR